MDDLSSVLAKLREIDAILSQPTAERAIPAVFRVVCVRLVELLDVQHATMTLLDEKRQFFRVEAEYPQLETSLMGERISIADRTSQLVLLNHQEPVVANDLKDHALVSESPSFLQVARTHDIRSLLIVPMVTDGYTVGTIGIDSVGQTKCFSAEEIELCQVVADRAASFITICRLRDEQRKWRRHAELLVPAPERSGVFRRYEEVAQELFDELAGVIDYKKASLQLIVEGKRSLVGAYGFDKSGAHPWLLRPVEIDPIIREIVRTKRPTILSDTSLDDEWKKQAGTKDVNSWIGMPLVFQETIGILTLDHSQHGFYADMSEQVLGRLDELATQAAHEIGDTYKLDLAQHQIHALEIIREFAETVAAKLDTEHLLLAIASAISQGLECTRCSIFLAERRDDRDVLVWKAACEGAECNIVPEQVLPDPGPEPLPCPVHHAFRSGEAVFIDNREEERRFDLTHEFYGDARSMIVEPLKIADQIIGAVSAVHESPGWFAKSDQVLLETLARQVTIAIERDFGLDLVHSIGNKMLGATEVDVALKEIVSGAIKLARTDSGVIYELDEDGTKVVRSFKAEGSFHPKPRLDNPAGITRAVIDTKRMLEIPDIEEDSRVNPVLRGRYRSMFAVPLLLGESIVGVLYLNCRTVRKLSETERSLLDTLAGQAALAIQRTRLYEQIKDSEAMYRSLLDNIPQSVFRKDTNSRFTSANASFCRNLGKSLEEIIGKSDHDFYPPEIAEKFIGDDKEVMKTKRSKNLDEINQPIGGKKHWVRVVKTPVLDAAGKVTGVQAIFWDITQEKRMTERWQSLVEQSPDGIVVHEAGKITFANPAATHLLGVESANDLEERSILEFIDESSRSQAEKRLDKLVKKEEDVPPMEELRVQKKKTGEIVDVEVYSRFGTGNEIQAVFHDVTRTKTLLREMHHRVRRSFNEVDGLLTLQEQFTDAPDVLHAFDTIRERIQAMALVHSTLYRTDEESDVDMHQYLLALRAALLNMHDSPDTVAVDFSAPGIVLDEKRASACGHIVTELASNSLRYAFPSRIGQVSVDLRSDEEVFRLVVSDDGIGMKGHPGGTGEAMGLSLVRSLVQDDLKGVISRWTPTEATASEPGTHFTIEFPRTRKTESC